MTMRYSDGPYQTIRLERPSESIRQMEFSDFGRHIGRDGRDDRYAQQVIKVVAATYGRNCGAQYGNVTSHVASLCDGKTACDHIIEAALLGDPAYGCRKDFVAEWRCGNAPETGSAVVGPEA
jgi:hypothetical protein